MASQRLLQVLRIPVLVVLLAVAVAGKPDLVQAITRLELTSAWRPWLLIVGAGVAFVAAALPGRGRHHPGGVLVTEGIIAAVVGLVPPMAWLEWFGVGPLATLGVATGNMFAQALAIAWLGIVVATAVRQARDDGPRASHDRDPHRVGERH